MRQDPNVQDGTYKLSVIIPCYNEMATYCRRLELLYKAIAVLIQSTSTVDLEGVKFGVAASQHCVVHDPPCAFYCPVRSKDQSVTIYAQTCLDAFRNDDHISLLCHLVRDNILDGSACHLSG
jgi:hypothetical protein